MIRLIVAAALFSGTASCVEPQQSCPPMSYRDVADMIDAATDALVKQERVGVNMVTLRWIAACLRRNR